MADKKIRLKAKKGAPEFVVQGNLRAEIKNGYYETDNPRFADYLIGEGYASDVEEAASPKRTAASKPKPEARQKRAKTVEPSETVAKTEKAAVALEFTGQVEPKTEGGTE